MFKPGTKLATLTYRVWEDETHKLETVRKVTVLHTYRNKDFIVSGDPQAHIAHLSVVDYQYA